MIDQAITIDQFIFEKLWPDECWHSYTVGYKTGGLSRCSCGAKGCAVLDSCQHSNPDFSTGDGMMKLKDRLVELGMWSRYIGYTHAIWYDQSKEGTNLTEIGSFTAWLIDQPRFRDLVGEFLGWEV